MSEKLFTDYRYGLGVLVFWLMKQAESPFIKHVSSAICIAYHKISVGDSLAKNCNV